MNIDYLTYMHTAAFQDICYSIYKFVKCLPRWHFLLFRLLFWMEAINNQLLTLHDIDAHGCVMAALSSLQIAWCSSKTSQITLNTGSLNILIESKQFKRNTFERKWEAKASRIYDWLTAHLVDYSSKNRTNTIKKLISLDDLFIKFLEHYWYQSSTMYTQWHDNDLLVHSYD